MKLHDTFTEIPRNDLRVNCHRDLLPLYHDRMTKDKRIDTHNMNCVDELLVVVCRLSTLTALYGFAIYIKSDDKKTYK